MCVFLSGPTTKKKYFFFVSSLSGSNTKKLYDPLPPAGSPRSSRAGWPGGLEPAQSPVHRPMSSLRHTAQLKKTLYIYIICIVRSFNIILIILCIERDFDIILFIESWGINIFIIVKIPNCMLNVYIYIIVASTFSIKYASIELGLYSLN